MRRATLQILIILTLFLGTGILWALDSLTLSLHTFKVKEEWNFVNYKVTLINRGSTSISRPTVTYFAAADTLLTATVDYSKPSGVTVSLNNAAQGYTRVVYRLPGDLAAGATAVFHTRIYRENWSARSFSADWSHQNAAAVKEPNLFWTVYDSDWVLLYGNNPITQERRSDVVLWYDRDGPSMIQPYQSGDTSRITAPRLWLMVKDPLTSREVRKLAALRLHRLEGAIYQNNGLYLFHQDSSVRRSSLDSAISGFYNTWAVDTVGVSFARAQTPAGDTTSAYHIEVSCWPDLGMNACRELARNCGATRALIDRSLILADIPKSAISCLTAQGSIRSLREQAEYPVTNNTARVASHLDSLQTGTLWNQALQQFPPTETWLDSVPYTGKGILVGVYDTGINWSHPDFNELDSNGDTVSRKGRLEEMHAVNPDSVWHSNISYAAGEKSHGTHVAGIIGGNGWMSDYSLRGVAPKVHFFSQTTDYICQVGHVVNHSHISEINQNYYSIDAKNIDAPIFWNWLQRSEAADSLVKTTVAAAANNGGYSPSYGNQRGYHSILVNAKNPIVVGNYASLTGKRHTSSSMGPTWDGRIKPDIMAPGSRAEYPFSFPHPLQVWVDYVRLYHAGATQPYWEDNFSEDALSHWNEGYNVAGEVVIDSQAQDGSALLWVDSLNGAKESYIIRCLDTTLALLQGDELEIRMRVEFPEKTYSSLGGQVFLRYSAPATWNSSTPSVSTVWELNQNGSYSITRTKLNATKSARYIRLDINHEEGILSTIPYNNSDPYEKQSGTSMASPHVAGIVALMLQKYRELTGMGLEKKSLRNSTSKAILIHTATDMVDAVGDSIEGNPDIDDTEADHQTHYVKYYEGPDFTTGWGKVNGKKALDYVDIARFKEVEVSHAEDIQWTIAVPDTQSHLRVTIAWDDAPISLIDSNYAYLLNYQENKLVNDLDLALISPSGVMHYPWRLAPLPVGITTTTDGIWRASGTEPIHEADIVPATRSCSSGNNMDSQCFDHLNNVEVVDVDTPEPGQWTLLLHGNRVMIGNNRDSSAQWVSIVSDDPLGTPVCENAHPYAPNQEMRCTYSLGHNLVSWVTFSNSTCMGSGDTLNLYDADSKRLGTYSGCSLAGETLEIMGSALTVELLSDGGKNTSYGFKIARIEGLPFSIIPLLWQATQKVK